MLADLLDNIQKQENDYIIDRIVKAYDNGFKYAAVVIYSYDIPTLMEEYAFRVNRHILVVPSNYLESVECFKNIIDLTDEYVIYAIEKIKKQISQ